MFCLNCPYSYAVTAPTARWQKTRRVRLVIRDKSCRHCMTKSLGGKCSHVCLGVCVGRVAQEMKIHVGCEYENILQTGKTFHLTWSDLISTVSSCLHISHTKMHYLYTHTPFRTKCAAIGNVIKEKRTYLGKPDAKYHHFIIQWR